MKLNRTFVKVLKKNQSQKKYLKNSGQIVVEYILLLVFAVGIAILVTHQLVSRSEDSPGIMTRKWRAIIQEVGKDHPDDLDEQ